MCALVVVIVSAVLVIALAAQPSCARPERQISYVDAEYAPVEPTVRGISVGQANVNDQNLKNAEWRYAVRFVLDSDTTIDRFFIGFRAKGAGGVFANQGPGGYGAGSGGKIDALLAPIRPDGTPDLANPLRRADEVTAQDAYARTRADYHIRDITGMVYVDFHGAAVRGGSPYAVVFSNGDPDPAVNYFSINSPTMKASESGPNGVNNLTTATRGAIAGLDPREAVAWSTDSGSAWVWGVDVGKGYYTGSPTSDDGTRIPWYGWTEAPGPDAPVRSNQPYVNYGQTCTGCTLLLAGARIDTLLTEAGGYAPIGSSAGVITVQNQRTGDMASTGPLGSGVVSGLLQHPIAVTAGDDLTMTATGTVFLNPSNEYLQHIFGLGEGAWPFTTDGTTDRAQIFALPNPFNPGTKAAMVGRCR